MSKPAMQFSDSPDGREMVTIVPGFALPTGHTPQVPFTNEVCQAIIDTRNTRNRRFKKTQIKYLTRDMDRGAWEQNGANIVFGPDGELRDGQNRLVAVTKRVVETGPVYFDVFVGVSDKAAASIDTNVRRSGGDALIMDDPTTKNAPALNAALSHLYRYKIGAYKSIAGVYGGNNAPSNADILELRHSFPEMADSVAFSYTSGVKSLAPVSATAFSHFVFNQHNPAKAEEFFSLLRDGGGPLNHPVSVLRRRLQEDRNKPQRDRMAAPEVVGLYFRAWAGLLRGERLSCIVRPKGLTGSLYVPITALEE